MNFIKKFLKRETTPLGRIMSIILLMAAVLGGTYFLAGLLIAKNDSFKKAVQMEESSLTVRTIKKIPKCPDFLEIQGMSSIETKSFKVPVVIVKVKGNEFLREIENQDKDFKIGTETIFEYCFTGNDSLKVVQKDIRYFTEEFNF